MFLETLGQLAPASGHYCHVVECSMAPHGVMQLAALLLAEEYDQLVTLPCRCEATITPSCPAKNPARRFRRAELLGRPHPVHEDEFAAAACELITPGLSHERRDVALFHPQEDALRAAPQRCK